jgi:hypothetical protein
MRSHLAHVLSGDVPSQREERPRITWDEVRHAEDNIELAMTNVQCLWPTAAPTHLPTSIDAIVTTLCALGMSRSMLR